MKKKPGNDVFSATNALKVLSFLAENAGREFLGSEIRKATALSRMGVYVALGQLSGRKLALKVKKGKFWVYTVAHNNPVVRQFKALRNIILLTALVGRLQPVARKIVLFGSAGRGEDSPDSDFDLFVLAKDPETVNEVLASERLKRKMQAIVKSPSEMVEFRQKESVFAQEIDRGITLWEEGA